MNVPNTLKFTGKDSSIKGLEKIKLLRRLSSFKSDIIQKLEGKDHLEGKVPNLLIGDYGYPNVNAGFLSTDEYKTNDSPKEWVLNPTEFDLAKIIQLRSSLINSKTNVSVKTKSSQFSDKLKEISLSIKPVDADVSFDKKVHFNLSMNADLLPHGPSTILKNLKITENPKIPTAVEKIESDIDFKANSAILELYKKKFDEHYLTKILSAGNLGTKLQRKIVPTKWAITAVDDTVGKDILSTIINAEAHPLSVFFGGYMGNYYFIIVFPGPWSFELFETYVGPGLSDPSNFESSHDYEGSFGRKDYASETVGGYYASRLAILEYLQKMRMIGRVLVLRFITDEYWAPLGVWVVREASRNALTSSKIEFESEELLYKYAEILLKKRFNIDFRAFLRKSNIYILMKSQKTLFSF